MRRVVGTDAVREFLPDLLTDESRFTSGVPTQASYPEKAAELRQVMREAAEAGRQVTLVGGQTGTTGGAVPLAGTWAIAFAELNRIEVVCWDDFTTPVLLCGPGVTLEAIQRFLANPAAWPYEVPGSEGLAPGAFCFLPDPTEATAQLGGMVSTNASGARSYRFGPIRRHVASLDLVLAGGETLSLRRTGEPSSAWTGRLVTDQGTVIDVPPLPYVSPPWKSAAGYFSARPMEPVDLFIGAEGTLAAIARVGIALAPAPSILAGLTFFAGPAAAFDFADFLRGEPALAAIEFFDRGSLRFINRGRGQLAGEFPAFPEGAGAAVLWEYVEGEGGSFEADLGRWEAALARCGASFATTWSGFDERERARLRRFRHALPEMVNRAVAENKRSCGEIRKIGTDSAFPAEAFRRSHAEMVRRIEESGLPHVVFGHLGDHHLHVNLLPRTAEELDLALRVYGDLMTVAVNGGGTVSAEHGIGKIKKRYLQALVGDAGIAAMRKVKAALDPWGMLNPGNLF